MSEPSATLVDWTRSLLGGAVTIGDPLHGASTATVWPVAGPTGEVVVKVYDRGIDGVGADDVARDAQAMRAAEEVGIVAPRLVADDPDGAHLGYPAIVMTRLAGDPRAHGRPDREAWVDGLADVLIAVAHAPMPTEPLHERRPWHRLPIEAPDWAVDQGPWLALNDVLAEPLPAGPSRFIHRDVHQLNVLWEGDAPVGLVDWVNGCIGPIESDIACCRLNIALAEDDQPGFELADRFLQRCLDAGLSWHPGWDLEWIASSSRVTDGFLNGIPLGAQMSLVGVRAVFDEAVPRALAAIETWNG